MTCLPKKFLCRYQLALGAIIFGSLFACVHLICILLIAIVMVGFSRCEKCPDEVLRTAYGFSGTAIIYCIIMIMVHLWFVWAVNKKKSSVVLTWVVVTTMWLIQTFCLTVVHLFMYLAHATFVAWIICTLFGLVALGISIYGVFIGLGLWVEMKKPQSTMNTEA